MSVRASATSFAFARSLPRARASTNDDVSTSAPRSVARTVANDPNLWLENWFACVNADAIRVLAKLPVAKTHARTLGCVDEERGVWIPGGRTLGMIASGRGDAEFVRELFNVLGKSHFDLTDDDGRIAMHYAAAKGSVEIVRALVDIGLDADARDDAGATPLVEATTRGNVEVVSYLMDLGADVTVKTGDGIALDGYLAQAAPRFNDLLLRALRMSGPGGCSRLRRGQKTYLRDRVRLSAILSSLSVEQLVDLAVDWRASTRDVGRPPEKRKLVDALLATTP